MAVLLKDESAAWSASELCKKDEGDTKSLGPFSWRFRGLVGLVRWAFAGGAGAGEPPQDLGVRNRDLHGVPVQPHGVSRAKVEQVALAHVDAARTRSSHCAHCEVRCLALAQPRRARATRPS